MSDILSNPLFYIIIAVSIVGGNIALLKYTANMKFPKGKIPKKENDKKDENNDEKL